MREFICSELNFSISQDLHVFADIENIHKRTSVGKVYV